MQRPTPSTATTEVALMNADAIACMKQGNNRQAIQLLKVALERVQERFPLVSSEEDPIAWITQDTKNCVVSCCAEIEKEIFPSGCCEEHMDTSFFNCAFYMPATATAATVSCILLYNAGLASHREALTATTTCKQSDLASHSEPQTTTPCKQSVVSHIALDLYQHALFRYERYNLLSRSHGMALVLYTAILHNMSILQSGFLAMQETRDIQIKLVNILKSNSVKLFMPHDDYAFFRGMLICSMRATFRSAAAA